MNNLGFSLRLDPIIGDEIFDSSKRRHYREPEKELMLAVLADAIECYWQYCRSRDGIGLRLYRDAAEWIFSDDEADYFSFLNVCGTLRLDPGYIRRGVRAGEAKRLSGQVSPGGRPINFRVKSMARNPNKGARWAISSGGGARSKRAQAVRRRMRGKR